LVKLMSLFSLLLIHDFIQPLLINSNKSISILV
jgi:hypothetical protein